MSADVVVIGAGLAGLAAGVRLAGAGRRVVVLERNAEPGGCATSYRRGRFAFEASLHLLDAAGPGEPNHRMLEQLGVAGRIELLRPEPLRREVWPELGVDLEIPQARAAEVLPAAFPEDRDGIRALFALARRVHTASFAQLHGEEPPHEHAKLAVRLAREDGATLIARHLADPRARAVLGSIAQYIGLAPAQISALPMLVLLHGYLGVGGWAVRGGSRSLAEALRDELLARGGALRTGVAAVGIEVVGRRVRGVRTADGGGIEARAVVAALPPAVVYRMVPPESVSDRVRADLAGRVVAPSIARLALGVAAEVDGPYETIIGGPEACAITVPTRVDRSWSPPGTSVVTCSEAVPPSASPWSREQRDRCAERLLDRVERYLGPVRGRIEAQDLAQPSTWERYVGAPEGAVLGYALAAGVRPVRSRTDIVGLVLAGGWTFPGPGQTACMISGWLAAGELGAR